MKHVVLIFFSIICFACFGQYGVGNGDGFSNFEFAQSDDPSLNIYAASNESDGFAYATLGGVDDEKPLPVSLFDFDAFVSQDFITIFWSTASETNNDFFILERSIEGQQWSLIKKVVGAGNSSYINEYEAVDYELYNGIVYYRLKQVDYDGTVNYSKVISVDLYQNIDTTISISYNKRKQKIIIDVIDDRCIQGFQNLDFISVNGKKIIVLDSFVNEIPISEIPQGFYYVYLKCNSSVIVFKFLKE